MTDDPKNPSSGATAGPGETPAPPAPVDADGSAPVADGATESVEELGGPKGPEPTRFGDWERNGRCSDF